MDDISRVQDDVLGDLGSNKCCVSIALECHDSFHTLHEAEKKFASFLTAYTQRKRKHNRVPHIKVKPIKERVLFYSALTDIFSC